MNGSQTSNGSDNARPSTARLNRTAHRTLPGSVSQSRLGHAPPLLLVATILGSLPIFALQPACKPNPVKTPRATTKPLALVDWNVTAFKTGGVRVLLKRAPGKKVVAMRLYFQGGCQNLTDANAGIEKLVLSTTEIAGSRKYPMDRLARFLYSRGIQIYTGTGQDYSVLAAKAIQSQFRAAWDVLVDLALHPILRGPGLKVQRQRQMWAVRTQYDEADQQISLKIEKEYFKGHPYERRQMGTVENLKRFTPQDLERYHRTMLQADRLLLVVTGDVDPAELKTLAIAAFGNLASSSQEFHATPPPRHEAPRLIHVPRDLPTNYILAYFAAPTPGQPDYAAARLAAKLLSNKLFEDLRTQRRLCYAVSAGLSVRRSNVGYIYMSTRSADQALRQTVRIIDELKHKGVTAKELAGLKAVFLTKRLMKLQTQSAQAKLLARSLLVVGNWRWAGRSLAAIAAVTRPQLQAALNRYLKNLQVVVLGPKSPGQVQIP
ncbi:MAG: insulinase family protein [Deltaproteobacteria bacterium]|nr:insulinase family protein [Deltaproteobacteria bacterium]